MKKSTILGIVLSTLLLCLSCISCETVESDTPVPLRKDAVEKELTEMLDAGHFASAIQMVDSLQRNTSLFSKIELEYYFDSAAEGLSQAYKTAVEKKEYHTARRHLLSLTVLGRAEVLESWNMASLMIEEAKSYFDSGNICSSLNLLARIEGGFSLSEQWFHSFMSAALDYNNRDVLEKLAAYGEERGFSVSEEYREFLGSPPSAQDQIKGTVTIWVNRGIKLEDGVGLPDRVIGSGFFIDKRGYLITNYHVIASEVDPKYEGFSRLYIRLPERPEQRVPAKVIGYDRIFDIALLKVEIDVPYVFSFNDTRELRSGLPIYAIGSPIGLDKTITSGIISATERRFLQMGDAIQIDVPVNPGSSGGPLLNKDGRLIGIVFAGLLQFESINFAIPAFWLRRFLPSFYEGGEVTHPWLGAAVYKRDNGLEIQYVPPDSPADRAGLQAEDIITGIAGVPVKTIAAAQDILLSRFPESLVSVTWLRSGSTMEALISLGERPFSPVEEALEKDLKHRLFPVLFGMRVKKSGSTFFQEDYVITEIYPGSPADETGLSVDDPFTLRGWLVDEDQRAVLLQIYIRKRKAGFLEAGIQLVSYLELDNFI